MICELKNNLFRGNGGLALFVADHASARRPTKGHPMSDEDIQKLLAEIDRIQKEFDETIKRMTYQLNEMEIELEKMRGGIYE